MAADKLWSPEFPPVMEVSQTIWFEPLKTLRTLDLAELRVALRHDFPLLDEQPPIPGWSNESPAVSLVGPNARWPVAACFFANRDRTQRLLVQSDRLSLTWEFSLETEEMYPGFSVLASSLAKLYREFVSTLTSNSNPTPTIQRVELVYNNVLVGIDSEDVARALLDDRRIERTITERERDSVRLSKHYCGSAETNYASVQASVRDLPDTSDDESDDDESGHAHKTLGAILDMYGLVDIDEDQDFEDGLRGAHIAVLQKFVALTGWTEPAAGDE